MWGLKVVVAFGHYMGGYNRPSPVRGLKVAHIGYAHGIGYKFPSYVRGLKAHDQQFPVLFGYKVPSREGVESTPANRWIASRLQGPLVCEGVEKCRATQSPSIRIQFPLA